MNTRPTNERGGRRRAASWAARHALLAAAALGLGADGGCNALRLHLLSGDRPEARPGAEVRNPGLAAPGKYSFRLAPYVFLSDFELKKDLPLFQELAQLRDQVYRELQLPPADAIVQVYLFENRERYEQFMHARYPDLPQRRAFFVAQPRVNGSEDLLVYTFWGDRVQQDLRHELTHALLHSVLKEVPLWLDEGIAEYFELPPVHRGVNVAHVQHLRRDAASGVKPNLGRLENLSQVSQMTPAEYREAWAWVHLMLHSTPETRKVLVGYLHQLRVNPRPGPLAPRLAETLTAPDSALLAHLDRLQAGTRLEATGIP